jgi:hypothetical protein
VARGGFHDAGGLVWSRDLPSAGLLLQACLPLAELAKQLDAHAERIIKLEGGVVLLDKMFGMAEREGRAVLAHARSLRLTQQARKRPRRGASR